MGIKKPSVKTHLPPSGLAEALFTKVQQRVLAVLFGNVERTYYANEIIALAGSGTGAVQRALARLEAAGLVTVTRVGKQKHHQANDAAPVFTELRSIVLKTFGMADMLREALVPLTMRITAAFVYGSVAKGEDTAQSAIDLLVISDSLTYADLFTALEGAAERLGRPVNPTVYSRQELRKRVRAGNAFIKRVLSQPKLWVIGETLGLAA